MNKKGKGGKNRRRGKNESGDGMKRELILRDEMQEYAQVTKMLGNGRIEAFCFSDDGGKTRQCHIRGKMRKKVWINVGDIVLISLRDFQDDKADVILKYSVEEARKLKQNKEIPDAIRINEANVGADEPDTDEDVDFDIDSDDIDDI
ncbi:translation initiation factor 1A [Fonticula alba]|uniref:Translation initiation factor 1A n=1 Tax=Fonticula alba TaxID=691883 RepID=A0A058ZGI7_FONAL|nr:translation initiation factor 1A [Fonticula alba]KCV73076.1 translation initiation factor 1A [Fonticula alba]|eukprot:XP_009492777.1 translation initiation factor 1A [Fonticula alba]